MNLVIEIAKTILDIISVVFVWCIFNENQRFRSYKWIVTGISIVLAETVLVRGFLQMDDSIIELLDIITCIVVMHLWMRTSWKRTIVIYLVVDTILAVIRTPISGYLLNDKINEIWYEIGQCVVVAVLWMITTQKRRDINIGRVWKIPKSIIIVYLILLFGVGNQMVGVESCAKYLPDNMKQKFFVSSVVVCVVVSIAGLTGLYLGMRKVEMTKENEMLSYYNEMQQKYYEQLLQKEEDTRRFRHDMLGHMQCVMGYLENAGDNNLIECRAYLADMTEAIEGKFGKTIHTGNQVADIIISSGMRTLRKDANITIKGTLTEKLGVTDYDFCCIFANLINNAVEAVNQIPIDSETETTDKKEDENLWIHVKFAVGKKYMRIEVSNGIHDSQAESARRMQTTKESRKHHGYGIKNVKMTAAKYHGTLTTIVENRSCTQTVQLECSK